ncbi:hypothetical protein F7018_02870 [Tenacibaculum aiptasiae]|uniref:Uncharacterized protein n=1 Tax=Tenacibaculum aiptasiae TaxID=426481 RepID=A0A7J5ANU9_9FLAO|nr:hypothetical protein [Tenacibaculum aiptasiae]KAB1159269.1 hypothetical protein F7018_02870 [Tenacibaculum aiptasiae]
MKIEKINELPENKAFTKNKIQLKFFDSEELNRGQEIVYYSLYINNIDYTEEIFQQKKIPCLINDKTHFESELNNEFVFIPYDNGILLSIKSYKQYKLKVFIKEKGKITYDSYRGNYFYSNKHILINKRSVVITDINTLKSNRIRFESHFNIEWGILINNVTIRIIQVNNLEVIDYDIEKQKIITKTSLPILKEEFKQLFFRKQKENLTYLEVSLMKKNIYYSELIKLIS